MFNTKEGEHIDNSFTHQHSIEGYLLPRLLLKADKAVLHQQIQYLVPKYSAFKATGLSIDSLPIDGVFKFATCLEGYYVGIPGITAAEIEFAEEKLGEYILDGLKRNFPEHAQRKAVEKALLGEGPITPAVAYDMDPVMGAIIATLKTFPFRKGAQKESFFIARKYSLEKDANHRRMIQARVERDHPTMKIVDGKIELTGDLLTKQIKKNRRGSEGTLVAQELGKFAHPLVIAIRKTAR